MNLFRLARFFQPLQNFAGFGLADYLALGVGLLIVVLFAALPRLAVPLRRFAARTRACMIGLALLPVLLRLAILPTQPVPAPRVPDDYSYVLLGDTLAHFRLANPMHPMHRFFESVFTLQTPSWSSIYPPGQGIALAFGQLVFGTPWAGVALSCAALCALIYWMLRAWTTPVWALAGGLLAVMQFGPLSAWMNLYWGGAVSAVAGCLIFGALPRLRESAAPRHAVLLGAGLGLQMLCRPFESVFVAAAVALYAVLFLRRIARPGFVFAIVLLSMAPAGMLTLLQNKQVTGHWTTLPYMASRARYGIPTTFTFQPVPVPEASLTVEQKIDYDAQTAIHGSAPESFAAWLERFARRAAFYRFVFLAPLYLVLPLYLLSLRERRHLWLAAALLLLAGGTTFYVYFYPHYIAAATCLFVLIAVRGLETLSGFTIRGKPVGREAAQILLTLCAAHFVLWYGIYGWGNPAVLSALSDFDRQYAIPAGDPDGRLAIDAKLRDTPGANLVFGPDVFLTAYEPFSMVASHVLGRPLISMDNQNELLHIDPPVGTNLLSFLLARAATLACTQGATFYVVKSFAKPCRDTERVRFVSPIIQQEIRRLRPQKGDYVFAYLTKPNPPLEAIMREMDERFIVYCNNRVEELGNTSDRAQGGSYLSDLAGCKAIIATTGFSLIADSLFLGKPYFGVPLKGQFEQTHNARFLAQSGLGEYAEDPTRGQIESFLGRLPVFEARLAGHRIDPAEQEETLLGLLRELRGSEAGAPVV